MSTSWRVRGSARGHSFARAAVGCLLAATLVAACASSSKSGSGGNATTTVVTINPTQSKTLGTGVSAKSIKLGIALVDFDCIKQFTDSIRTNQNQIYQVFIDNVNQHGGINGRTIDPVFQSFCPIGSAGALSVCTSLTEDKKVFAVIGNLVDFSGDAQACVAKQHKRVLMTFQLDKSIIDKSPQGLIVTPAPNPERIDKVLIRLLVKQHLLDNKTVAVLGETTSAASVNSTIVPALKATGAKMGSTAILSISGTDTTNAQSQLDSFIERWKTEGVNALFITGEEVSSQQFIEKIRNALPDVVLATDITDVLTYAKEEQQAGKNPNPYEGIMTAAGPTAHEYDQSANWAYCKGIYKKETGKTPPNAESVIKIAGGKTLDTYGSINDACQLVTMFHDIATKAGPYLNDADWVNAVNHYGPITDRGAGQYASLRVGKYDANDTFRLEAFDSSIPPTGNWKPLTPLENITG